MLFFIFFRNSFSGLNPLKCLKIDDNGLKGFSNMQRLTKLQHLFANNNRINDMPDVERLTDLQSLKELELTNNPISRKAGYRQTMIKKFPLLIYLDGKVNKDWVLFLKMRSSFLYIFIYYSKISLNSLGNCSRRKRKT